MIRGQLVCNCRGNEQLHQIDSGLAGAKQGNSVPVIRVHAPIAIDRHAHRQVRIDHAVIAKFGNQEVLSIATVILPIKWGTI